MESKGPLKGIRILDLTRLLPGPLATQYMAELGADVIKIEDIDHPDYTRFFPPQVGGESVHFLSVNRTKKSLALRMDSGEGLDLFFELVRSADIVIEGFRPGRMDAMGIGYEAARKVHPGIIYVSISGYGQDGPLAGKAGHDLNYVGYTGLVSLQGKSGKMVMPGVQVADIMGGSYNAVIACLAAVINRNTSGRGQQVDVSMTDGALQMLSMPLGEFLNTGTLYGPGEFMLSGGLVNYHIYECSDGKYVALGALEPKFWMNFCNMAGHPEWMGRAMPGSGGLEALREEVCSFFMTRARDAWVEYAKEHDVCLTPVLGLDEVDGHPHFRARKMITSVDHPDYGTLKGIAQPLKFSDGEAGPVWAPPHLGEHSELVLKEFGFSEARISQLKAKDVIR